MPDTTLAELKYLIERQREEIKTINEVGRLLSAATNPHQIIRQVASYLNQTFPLAICSVALLESRKIYLTQFAKIAQVDIASAIRTLCAQLGQLAKRALGEQEMTQITEDQTPGGGFAGPIGYLRSNYATPLAIEGRVVGLLAVFSGKTDAFTKEDCHVIDIVGDQMRAALRNAFLLEALEHANQLKNELLMVISHELRIPLTSIKEGINLVLEGALGAINADQQDFLNTVNQSANRLETLVGKVVTATQLVTGQVQYSPQELDMITLLKELEAMFRPMAASKGVSFELTGIGGVSRIQADGGRLKEALVQLRENAVQATSEGKVSINYTESPDSIEVAIQDTGVGIPEEAMPTLFEQFRIIGGVDDRKTGGLGLGLFIAKAFVEVQGGTIDLKSQLGKGTRVVVKLPKKRPS